MIRFPVDQIGNRIGARAALKRSCFRCPEGINRKPYDTFLVTDYGAAFSPDGFGNWFREKCDAAGLKGLSAHGLRKAAARRLAEKGNSANRIASVTGHDTFKEVERYARAAEEATATMPDRSDREAHLPNHPERLDS